MIYGVCGALLLVPVGLRILAALNEWERTAAGSPETYKDAQNLLFLLTVLLIVLGVLNLIAAIFEAAAGYGMLKKRGWARSAGMLAGVVALLGFPVGTVLGVYALWFLFGQGAAQVYGGQSGAKS